MFKSLSHYEYFVHGVRVCSQFLDLHAAVQVPQHLAEETEETCLFRIMYSCFPYGRLIDHRGVGLSLGSLFCSIDLYVCFCTNITLF